MQERPRGEEFVDFVFNAKVSKGKTLRSIYQELNRLSRLQ